MPVQGLTVSYVSQPAPGANAPGVAAPAASPAANPLGFLGALLDQVLAANAPGSTEPPAPVPASVAAPVIPAPVTAASFGEDPLTALDAALHSYQQSLDAGVPPTPQQREALTAALDKLAAHLAHQASTAPATPPASGPDPRAADEAMKLLARLGLVSPPPAGPAAPALSDRLRALAEALTATDPILANRLDTAALDIEATTLPATTALVSDDALIAAVTRILAVAPANTPATGTSPAPSQPAPVTPDQLAARLTNAATALAAEAPALATKIEAVAARLTAPETAPAIAALFKDAAPDPVALERIVRQLLDGRPATPQTALTTAAAPAAVTVTTDLEIPAAILPDKTQTAVTGDKAALPQPAPVTADLEPTAPPALRTTAERATPAAPDARADTAPRIVADIVKADTPDQPAPQPPATAQQPQPAAIHATRLMPAAYQAVPNPINMGQVAFEMVRQIHQGQSRFTIRLDPPELGRVDVKMQVDAAGGVSARLVVDRPETLDLFQRDQRTLERALAQAGLDSARTHLEFSLRQNPFGGSAGNHDQQQHQSGSSARFTLDEAGDLPPIPAITLYRGNISAGGVNIFA